MLEYKAKDKQKHITSSEDHREKTVGGKNVRTCKWMMRVEKLLH